MSHQGHLPMWPVPECLGFTIERPDYKTQDSSPAPPSFARSQPGLSLYWSRWASSLSAETKTRHQRINASPGCLLYEQPCAMIKCVVQIVSQRRALRSERLSTWAMVTQQVSSRTGSWIYMCRVKSLLVFLPDCVCLPDAVRRYTSEVYLAKRSGV